MFRGMYRGSGQGGEPVNYNRVIEKIAVIPSAETATVGKVYMYDGVSDSTYTHGYIYECVATQTATAVSFSGNIISNWAVADFVSYLQEGGAEYNEITHGTLTYDATGGLWVLVGFDANGIKIMQFQEYTEDLEEFGCTFASETHQDGDSCNFTMTTEESGKKWKRLDVQPAGAGGGAVESVNGHTGVVVLGAEDVGALANTTKYVASASWTIDSSTYVMTLQLKDQDGANIGTAQTIDLPLESVVVGGSYDNINKKIVLTLNNGTTIDVPVADLVSGLQSEITSQNPLSADLVDDTNSTHKFVSSAEKSTWNGKQDAINDLSTIRSGAAAGATAVKPEDLATVATSGDYDDLTNKPQINGVELSGNKTTADLGIKGTVQIAIEGTTTVQGYVVPNPTAEEMTAIYNAIVAGNGVYIVDSNDVYYQVLQADSVDDAINVEILFFSEVSLLYTLENDTVSISYKKLGGGVSDVTVNGTSVVSGGVAAITMPTIDDTSTSSLTATWSASKLNTTIGNIESLLAAI